MTGEMDFEGSHAPSAINTTKEFGVALTKLRDRAGMSVRSVAQAVGVPRATIGDYFAGKSLPGVEMSWVLPKILVQCGVSDPVVVETWLQALIRVRRTPGPVPANSPAPYRGLESFQPEDAEWFHGRDQLVQSVVNHVHARRRRGGLLFVIGPSGVGKSSLLRAGLIPALGAEPTDGDAPRWLWRLLTPGRSPLGQLVESLTGSVRAAEELEGRLRVDPSEARCVARELVKSLTALNHTASRLLIIVDQFEELFMVPITDAERLVFIDVLCALAAADSPMVVVLGMRSDFYDKAVWYRQLAAALQAPTVVVGPMSEDELRAAIIQPAQRARADIEDGLVELLLRDFQPLDSDGRHAHDSGALPLLSHALLATWRSGSRRKLTTAGYLATGGVAHAVGQSANTVYLSLTETQQRVARSLFLRLVHLGDRSVDTRRRVTREELPDHPNADLVEVLARFVEQRLITVDADTVQISHEALVHAWSRLREWLDADREGLRVHRRLQTAAISWQEAGYDPSSLYRGVSLAAAQEWADAADHTAELNAVEFSFLNASLEEQARQSRDKRKQVRRLRQWVAALVVAVLVAGGLVIAVFELRSNALNDRNLAVSRHAALQAADLRSTDPALAAQLALAAYRIAPTSEARSSLLDAGVGPMVSRVRGSDGTIANAVSPDGQVLATGGADGIVRLWRVSDQGRLDQVGSTFAAAPNSIYGAAINGTGRLLAVTGLDRVLRLWDISDPTHPEPLPDPQLSLPGTGYAVTFSPGGQYLAVVGQGGIRVWTLDLFGMPDSLALATALDGDIKAVAFSPDGQLLAAGGLGQSVHFWRLDGSSPPSSLDTPITGLPSGVYSLVYSPDGQTLAIGSGNRAVYMWDVRNPDRPVLNGEPLTGFTGPVYAVEYSDDGRWLAAGSSDSTVYLWETVTRRQLAFLPHSGPVTGVVYLPNSHKLITAAADGYARLWTLPGGVITGLPGPVSTIAFGPSSPELAVSSSAGGVSGDEGTVEWWDISDPHHPVPTGHAVESPVGASRFTGASVLSPNGQLLAVGSSDGSSRLWDVRTPTNPVLLGEPLTGPTASLQTLAFTPDSRILAIGGDDHRVFLWDLRTPAAPHLLAILTDSQNIVMTVAFSPDGHLLAAASADHKVYLWDISDPTRPRLVQRIFGHTNYAYAVAFSPDGNTLAVGSADKTVSLWDIRDNTQPRQIGQSLVGPTNYVYAVTFASDGRLLTAVSTDGTVWLWDISRIERPHVFATLRATDSVFAVAVSPDGQTLAAGTTDKSVRLWSLDPEKAATSICTTAGNTINEAEWEQYIPDLDYNPPC